METPITKNATWDTEIRVPVVNADVAAGLEIKLYKARERIKELEDALKMCIELSHRCPITRYPDEYHAFMNEISDTLRKEEV